jgi:hypothetical protein
VEAGPSSLEGLAAQPEGPAGMMSGEHSAWWMPPALTVPSGASVGLALQSIWLSSVPRILTMSHIFGVEKFPIVADGFEFGLKLLGRNGDHSDDFRLSDCRAFVYQLIDVPKAHARKAIGIELLIIKQHRDSDGGFADQVVSPIKVFVPMGKV